MLCPSRSMNSPARAVSWSTTLPNCQKVKVQRLSVKSAPNFYVVLFNASTKPLAFFELINQYGVESRVSRISIFTPRGCQNRRARYAAGSAFLPLVRRISSIVSAWVLPKKARSMCARPTRSSSLPTVILRSIALLITGTVATARIRAINPVRLSNAAQMESAIEARRKKMKARSQNGGLTVSEKMILSSFTGSTGLTVSDFQVTLSA